MCLLKIQIKFSIHYHCQYGQSLYISGDVSDLGRWDPRRAIKLNWNADDIWTKTIWIKHDIQNPINYKYFVSETHGEFNSIHWESGYNRIIGLNSIRDLHMKIDDVWEHRAVRIDLVTSEQGTPIMIVFGQEWWAEFEQIEQFGLYEGEKIEFTWKRDLLVPLSWLFLSYTFVLKENSDSSNHLFKVNRTPPRKISLIAENSPQMKKRRLSLHGDRSPDNSIETKFWLNKLKISEELVMNKQLKHIYIDKHFRIGHLPSTDSEANLLKNDGVETILFVKEKRKNDQYLVVFSEMVKEKFGFNVSFIEINGADFFDVYKMQIHLNSIQQEKSTFLLAWIFDPREVIDYAFNHLCFFRSFSKSAAKKFLHVDIESRTRSKIRDVNRRLLLK